MEQEKELLHGQTSWLNEELKAKSEELLSLSRQKGNQILELRCKLENKEEEVCAFTLPAHKKIVNIHAGKGNIGRLP